MSGDVLVRLDRATKRFGDAVAPDAISGTVAAGEMTGLVGPDGAGKTTLIYRGRAIAIGSPDKLKARAASPERPDPTMEDSFIALVEADDRGRRAA